MSLWFSFFSNINFRTLKSGAAKKDESARASFERKLSLYFAQLGIDPKSKGAATAAASSGAGMRVNGVVVDAVRIWSSWCCFGAHRALSDR